MGGFSTATAAGGLFEPAVYMPVADRPHDEVIHIYVQFHCTMMSTRALAHGMPIHSAELHVGYADQNDESYVDV